MQQAGRELRKDQERWEGGCLWMEKASGRGARTGELKNPVQGAPHKLEDVLESRETGNYARMQIFIFSWPSTFNLKIHSLNMLMLIHTQQTLRYLGETNKLALGRKSSRLLAFWTSDFQIKDAGCVNTTLRTLKPEALPVPDVISSVGHYPHLYASLMSTEVLRIQVFVFLFIIFRILFLFICPSGQVYLVPLEASGSIWQL